MRIPKFRGRGRLLKVINRVALLAGRSPIAEARMVLGYRMKVDLRGLTEFQSYYTGEYDTDILRSVLETLPSEAIIADVGANIGFHAVPLALRASSGMVHCFEPLEVNRDRLTENLALNRVEGRCRVHDLGLSDQAGVAQLTLREDFVQGARTGNAAIDMGHASDAAFQKVQIRLDTLDHVVEKEGWPRLDFIKVDIEGHEEKFLIGAQNTLRRFKPRILAELSEEYFSRQGRGLDENLLPWIRALGYRPHRFREGQWVPSETLLGRRVGEDLLLLPT